MDKDTEKAKAKRMTPSAADMSKPVRLLSHEVLLTLFRGEASDTERLEELRNELLTRLVGGDTEGE